MPKTGDTSTEEATEQTAPETPETESPAAEPEAPEAEVDERDNALPEWAKKKLTKANAEAANYRTRLREVEQKLADAKTPEQFEAAVAEIKQANANLKRQAFVRDIADEHGLPKELAARLQGNTREELVADAKALVKFAVVENDAPGELRGGLDPSDDEAAFDPVKAAAEARARRY